MELVERLKLFEQKLDELAKNIYTNNTVSVDDLQKVKKAHDNLLKFVEKDKELAFTGLKALLKSTIASDKEDVLLDILTDSELSRLKEQEARQLKDEDGDLVKKITLDVMVMGSMSLLFAESSDKLVADMKSEQDSLEVLLDLVGANQGEKVAKIFKEVNGFVVAKTERMMPQSDKKDVSVSESEGPRVVSMQSEASREDQEAPSEQVGLPFLSTITSMLGLGRN